MQVLKLPNLKEKTMTTKNITKVNWKYEYIL